MSNARVAAIFREAAALYEAQDAEPFRMAALRRAARTLTDLDEDVADILAREGMKGLLELPGIGQGLARAIVEIVALGTWGQLGRLRAEHDPVHELMRVPGVGEKTARRIVSELLVMTLEDLEAAAHDGRLSTLPGLGPRKVQAISAILASALGRRAPRPKARGDSDPELREQDPPVATLLDVDHEYRMKASEGTLKRIAPRRLNPSRSAWLPILHTRRGPYAFTALYSNTPRAHELGRTFDWVVLYWNHDEGGAEGQHTVVTERRGALKGQRVVRGREAACRSFYESALASPQSAPASASM